MSDSEDARLWLRFARENLQVAEMGLKAGLLNPCLENAQQATEKALKSVIVFKGQSVRRTHSIVELVDDLSRIDINAGLSLDESESIDSIYRPSRYPVESALPRSMPTEAICRRHLDIAQRAIRLAESLIPSS
jgi:HEPN domain-containing protein